MAGQCVTDACTRPALGRGLCAPCYSRWHRAQKKYAIICAHCGSATNVSRKQAMYCSRSCSSRAAQPKAAAGRAERMKAEAAIRRAERSQVIPYDGPQFRRVPTPRANAIPVTVRQFKSSRCKVCNAWFVTLNTDVTCSAECQQINSAGRKRAAKGRRRAVMKGAYVADVQPRRIFERDGYRCHLCRRKTDLTKQVPHPRSPTIDHVIPLSSGGTHEPINCRTACFRCNCLKGDRGGGEQLLLIA